MYDPGRFENDYLRRKSDLEKAAKQLEEYLLFVLSESRVLFHHVTFRVKRIESAQQKILSKSYDQPWGQLMDLIAGRIFTYFKEDSPLVEGVIREHFTVDDGSSINKADDLGHNEFGYTSRHLVCRVSHMTQDLRLGASLRDLNFEIQIRTVLEHGWAEIEHELVYKARTAVPELIRRRFAASAAALELIEHEFSRLRDFEPEIIVKRTELVPASSDVNLDRAWLIAVLTRTFPGRATWSPNPSADNFYRGNEITILNFLTANGIATVGQWATLLTSSRTNLGIMKYAQIKSINAELVNHLPIAAIACAEVSGRAVPATFEKFFDEALEKVFSGDGQPE